MSDWALRLIEMLGCLETFGYAEDGNGEADMTCDRCTRAPVGACVGEAFCASLNMTDEDACRLAADICLSWWQNRDNEVEIDDALWEISERRIDELASDPAKARAYLAERSAD